MCFKLFKQALSGLVLSICCASSYAEEMTAVEWAPFVKAAGITDQQLIAAADKVNSDFLANQPGFIKRELIKKNETEYADIVYWNTQADALAAGNKVSNSPVCGEYFRLMDMAASGSAGAGFSHYNILKTW
ncbi:MAG: hypothetical protein V7731_01350 [Amphritea sp.]